MGKPQKRNFLLANSSGFTLVGVLMVLVVLSVLGLSILMITTTTVKLSEGERNDQSVFYIAEAGVVETAYEINEDVNEAFEEVKAIYSQLSNKDKEKYDFVGEFYSRVIGKVNLMPSSLSFERNLGNKPFASVTLNQNGAGPIKYEIVSEGTIGNKTRTVRQELTIFLQPSMIEGPSIPGNVALSVKTTIDLAGSVTIYGDANMESTNIRDKRISGGASVTGKVNQGVNSVIELPPFPAYPTYTIPPDQIYTNNGGNKTDLVKDGKLLIGNYITNGYRLNMSGNMEYKEIYLNENNTLTINVGDKDKEIVVNHLNVTNGHIKIIGSGKLTMYVKNNITMGAGSTINDNTRDVGKLKIYQKSSSPINLSGAQKVYGSLYAEAADISISGGGGFQGDIFTGGKNVYVGGGASVNSQLFLAPNAKFVLGEGGHIKGAIVGDSFSGTGGGSVRYTETNSGLESGGMMKDYGDGSNLITKTQLIEE